MLKKLLNGARMLQRTGLRATARECAYRINNAYLEHRLGVSTSGFLDNESLGYADADCVHYAPLGYRQIRDAFQRLSLNWAECTLLDYGCGKGRAVVVAATMPFRRVIGVELSEPLFAEAKANVAKMRRRRADAVDLHCLNATEYEVPPDVNVIYFFNPFRGPILKQVLLNIRDSVRKSPRRIHILFFNRDNFERIAEGFPEITAVEHIRVYPNIGRGIYVIDPDPSAHAGRRTQTGSRFRMQCTP